MTEIPPDVEAAIAKMSDTEYAAFTAKVRAPDSTEALKAAAGQHISGDQLDAFVSVADISKFVDDQGAIDAGKVATFMRTVFGATPQPAPQWGQGSARGGPVVQPGQQGRTALARRFGIQPGNETPPTMGKVSDGRGAAGRAAVARRHPQNQENRT